MADSPTIEIIAADPYRLGVVMPSDAVAGKPTWCIVRAEDRYGNPATRYRGTIQFGATDDNAELPSAYTFTEADRGVRRFENVIFHSTGDFHGQRRRRNVQTNGQSGPRCETSVGPAPAMG